MGSVGGVWGAVGLLELRHAGKGGLLSCPPNCLRHWCLVGLPYWSGSYFMVLHACCSWVVRLVLVGLDLMLPLWPWVSLTWECLPCRVSLVLQMLGAHCGLVLLPWSLPLGL